MTEIEAQNRSHTSRKRIGLSMLWSNSFRMRKIGSVVSTLRNRRGSRRLLGRKIGRLFSSKVKIGRVAESYKVKREMESQASF